MPSTFLTSLTIPRLRISLAWGVGVINNDPVLNLIASLLIIVGMVLLLVGGIAFLIAAFRESAVWGLLVLFLPLASLVFLVTHWSRAKDSFFLQLYGFGFVFVAALISDGHAWPLS